MCCTLTGPTRPRTLQSSPSSSTCEARLWPERDAEAKRLLFLSARPPIPYLPASPSPIYFPTQPLLPRSTTHVNIHTNTFGRRPNELVTNAKGGITMCSKASSKPTAATEYFQHCRRGDRIGSRVKQHIG